MDEILENSYFKNIRKQKYSFPKSNRFPDLKPKYTIDFYDSKIGNKARSTSFGFGAKYDFFRETKKGPSPFQYSLEDVNRVTRGLSFGRSRQEIKANSYIDPEKIKTPKPNEYNSDLLKIKKREPSCLILGRHPEDSFIRPNANPDPAKYSPSDTFTSSKRTLKYGFGSAERFDYHETSNRMVGPGTYSNTPQDSLKLGKMGQADRKTYAVEAMERSISPGPKYIVR